MKRLCGIFLILSIPFVLSAQCCSAGNPLSCGIDKGNTGSNVLSLGLSFRNSYSDTYYQGDSKSDYTYIDNSGFNFTSFDVSYGLTQKLTISASVGYFFSKDQQFSGSGYKRSANGLADADFGVRYLLLNVAGWSVVPGVSLKAPVGVFDQEFQNVVLPIDLQPSSGDFRYNTSLFARKQLRSSRWSFQTYNAIEIARTISTNRTISYKYGNVYLLSLAANYGIKPTLTASLQIRGEIRDMAVDKGKALTHTGGTVVYASPEISWIFLPDWAFTAQFHQPVYKKVNGLQLTNKYMLMAGIRTNFSL